MLQFLSFAQQHLLMPGCAGPALSESFTKTQQAGDSADLNLLKMDI